MKKNLVIVGAGGLGREILWQITDNPKEEKKYNILGFVDGVKISDWAEYGEGCIFCVKRRWNRV